MGQMSCGVNVLDNGSCRRAGGCGPVRGTCHLLAAVNALSASSGFRCNPQADRRRLLLTTPIHRRLAVATFSKSKM